ncbi:hypothetical protein TEA_005731 [Camellia sinensis var. sinensis]|uniref:Uncharacterized protein n=1 Tax=Camellia sinensis var. sinensis TaxID=542762 RepID=A0A4S4DPD5_CAMSN|nr:hypothetical protein TEA_005731 [Camellia sinensis var. sinensis]
MDLSNGPIMNWQPISVRNITPAIVKVEPSAVGSMASGPSFPHMPSVPRAASQVVPSLQASSVSQQTSSGLQSAQSEYVKVWEASKLAIISFDMLCLHHLRSMQFLHDPVKVSSPPKFSIVSCLGNLYGQRQGQPVFITRLEAYDSVVWLYFGALNSHAFLNENIILHASTREFVEAVRAYRVIFPDSEQQLIKLSQDLVTNQLAEVQGVALLGGSGAAPRWGQRAAPSEITTFQKFHSPAKGRLEVGEVAIVVRVRGGIKLIIVMVVVVVDVLWKLLLYVHSIDGEEDKKKKW